MQAIEATRLCVRRQSGLTDDPAPMTKWDARLMMTDLVRRIVHPVQVPMIVLVEILRLIDSARTIERRDRVSIAAKLVRTDRVWTDRVWTDRVWTDLVSIVLVSIVLVSIVLV